MGYPIIEFAQDRSFVVTKPAQTGGVVNILTVTERMLYEVLDPANYLLPNVNLELSNSKVVQAAPDRVRVSGARGQPPTPWLKCTAIRQDGYRIEGALMIPGHEARAKARILGETLIQRSNMILKRMGIERITEYRVETPGAEGLGWIDRGKGLLMLFWGEWKFWCRMMCLWNERDYETRTRRTWRIFCTE
jgi:hypothetical protein